jgi:hypothetical protein
MPYLEQCTVGHVKQYRQKCQKFEVIDRFPDRSGMNEVAEAMVDRVFEDEEDFSIGVQFNWKDHDHISSEKLCGRILQWLGEPSEENDIHKAELFSHAKAQRTLDIHRKVDYERILATIKLAESKVAIPLTDVEHLNLIKDFKYGTSIEGMDDDDLKKFYRKIDAACAEKKRFPEYVKIACETLQTAAKANAEWNNMFSNKSKKAGKDNPRKEHLGKKRGNTSDTDPVVPNPAKRSRGGIDWPNVSDSLRCVYCGRMLTWHMDKETNKSVPCKYKDDPRANQDKTVPWSKSEVGKAYMAKGVSTLPFEQTGSGNSNTGRQKGRGKKSK